MTSGKPLQNEDWNSVGDVLNKLSALGVRTYVALIGPSPGIPDFRSSLENPENVFAIPSRGDIPEQINQIGSQVLTDSGKLNSAFNERVRQSKKALNSCPLASQLHHP